MADDNVTSCSVALPSSSATPDIEPRREALHVHGRDRDLGHAVSLTWSVGARHCTLCRTAEGPANDARIDQDATLHVEVEGDGPPVTVFAHGLTNSRNKSPRSHRSSPAPRFGSTSADTGCRASRPISLRRLRTRPGRRRRGVRRDTCLRHVAGTARSRTSSHAKHFERPSSCSPPPLTFSRIIATSTAPPSA